MSHPLRTIGLVGVSCISVPAAGALAALAESVRLAKGDDPLAPVTIIVPTNAVGVTAVSYTHLTLPTIYSV